MADTYDPSPDTSTPNVYLNVQGTEGAVAVQ